MARLARVVVPGLPHHVVQRGVRSMDIFFSDGDRKEYLDLLAKSGRRWYLQFWAWCLMTNHVHLLVVPGRADSLARAVGEAHRRYTRMINFREGVRGHLFQERFHSCPIQKDRHLLAVARCVEMDPVRAGLVPEAEDYRWSSARHRLERRRDPLVLASPFVEMVGSWRRFLHATEDELEEERIERHLRTGRPYGSDDWTMRLEGRLCRTLLPRHGGWPKGKPRLNA